MKIERELDEFHKKVQDIITDYLTESDSDHYTNIELSESELRTKFNRNHIEMFCEVMNNIDIILKTVD